MKYPGNWEGRKGRKEGEDDGESDSDSVGDPGIDPTLPVQLHVGVGVGVDAGVGWVCVCLPSYIHPRAVWMYSTVQYGTVLRPYISIKRNASGILSPRHVGVTLLQELRL